MSPGDFRGKSYFAARAFVITLNGIRDPSRLGSEAYLSGPRDCSICSHLRFHDMYVSIFQFNETITLQNKSIRPQTLSS